MECHKSLRDLGALTDNQKNKADLHEHEKREKEAECRTGESIRFWVRPVVRQYFHKGLLWRSAALPAVARYELFVGLLYVGVVATVGDIVVEEATGHALLRFAITFTLGWKFWSDISAFIHLVEANDIFRRLSILFSLVCLLGLTTNMAGFFDSTYTPLIAFYITGRLHFAAHYAWLAYLMPMVRGTMIGFCIMNVIPSALWIGSIHVKEFHRQALIWLAIALDMYGGTLLSILGSKPMPGRFRAWSERAFEFLPARGVDELIARTEEFVTLVFGYSVVALLYQNKAAFGINAFLGKAILGLVQAFSLNWLYFEIDLFNSANV